MTRTCGQCGAQSAVRQPVAANRAVIADRAVHTNFAIAANDQLSAHRIIDSGRKDGRS